MKPDYETGRVRLYCADCLDVLPTLETGSVDAIVTDPPYGVKIRFGNCNYSRRSAIVRYANMPIIGDDKPFDPKPFLGYPVVVLCGANNYSDQLPPSRGWIYWDKRPEMKQNDFGDGELIWTNQDRVIRKFTHIWNGILRGSQNGDRHYHPTEKPIALMKWLIENYTSSDNIILDPFMGSGTTGVAAVKLGHKFIGIEISPKYFEIAIKRIEQAERQLALIQV